MMFFSISHTDRRDRCSSQEGLFMSSSSRISHLGLAALAALAPTLASAHVGVGETQGFIHGFSHPVGGIDHILAMVVVGIFAANLGGRALWAVPLTFMAFMLVGGG